MTVTTVPSTLLREPQQFLAEVKSSIDLLPKAKLLATVSFFMFAAYGAVVGAAAGSLPQMLASSVKMPLLFLLTMAICFPTLQISNLLFGARHSAAQLGVLLLTALAATGTVLIGFLPISLFFLISSDSYAFFKLLNVGIVAVSAVYGLRFLTSGMAMLHEGLDPAGAPARTSVLTFWLMLYAFVGSQLAWVSRPFFGTPDMPFELFRDERGNFFLDIIRSALQIMGLG